MGRLKRDDPQPNERMLPQMKQDTILKGCLIAAAMVSLVLSIVIYFGAGDDVLGRLNGIYVGVWVPSILSLGALLLVARKSDA